MGTKKRSFNASVNSYTNDTYTDLVTDTTSEEIEVTSLVICNTSVGNIAASVCLTDEGNTLLSTIVSAVSITAGDSQAVDLGGSFPLESGKKIRVKGATAGLSFTAGGFKYN